MRKSSCCSLALGCFAALLACVASCGLYDRLNDKGKELVNAAGLSTNETLKLLLSGADVNRRSDSHFGWTPLISAVHRHKEDVLDLLLAYGANPNVGDNDNRTALFWAIECWSDNTNVLRKLIAHGADPAIKTKLGSDAFDVARSQPNANIIIEALKALEKKRRTASELGQEVYRLGVSGYGDSNRIALPIGRQH